MSSEYSRETDAIRYAVLRRLAPGMRHSLMGELQAIQFMAELTARQHDQSGAAARTLDGLQQVIAQTRSTVQSCRSIIEWLRPEPGMTTPLGVGVAECLKVVGDDWPLFGVEATSELNTPDTLVDRSALRDLLATSLMALTDMHPGPLDIDVHGAADAVDVELTVRARAAPRRSTLQPFADERRLTWADVQMLARAHGVSCSCQASGATIHLRVAATES